MTLDPNKKFNDLTPEEFAEFNQVRRWGADLYKGFHDRELMLSSLLVLVLTLLVAIWAVCSSVIVKDVQLGTSCRFVLSRHESLTC